MSSYVEKFMDENVNRYIHNLMPMRLLHLPEIKLMDRREIGQQVELSIRDHADVIYRRHGKIEGADKAHVLRPLNYAILSHRWSDHEPVFQDISKRDIGEVPSSPGLDKLKQFCSHARSTYKCEWAWSDTCCIDKNSSAELDESIRSMFRWYSQAEICLVCLGDTLKPDDIANDPWFTRGWTLQELLAPKQIRFFNKIWEPLATDGLGSKTSRAREVLFWAWERTTTREEDKAYSLLGLLDVSIPVAYGEGARAFYRLQVEIANTCDEGNLFHWRGIPSKYNSAFAENLSCFSFFEKDDTGNALIPPIPRGARSFTITNMGLRIQLPSYDVKSVISPQDGVGPTIVEIAGLPDIRIGDPLSFSAFDAMVVIIDFNHRDTYSDTYSDPTLPDFLADRLTREHVTKHAGKNLGDTKLGNIVTSLIKARKTRFYTAILLEYDDLFSNSYKRVKTSEPILVRRPTYGWKAPEEVHIK
jgi:hypothetical protein